MVNRAEEIAREVMQQFEELPEPEKELPITLQEAVKERADELGGLLSIVTCTEFLRKHTGVLYSTHPEEGEVQSPIYQALRRGQLQGTEVGGVTFIPVETFLAYLRRFQPRIPQEGVQS